jgi:hypothetical protein
VQDREGYLWVTNDHELHRFDGRQFLKQSLSSSCLIPDTEKLLKMVHFEDSLFLISGETQVIIFNPITKDCEAFPKPFYVRNEFFGFKGVDKEPLIFSAKAIDPVFLIHQRAYSA